MSKDIVTLNHTDDLLIAEKLFKKHQIRQIPVVNGESIIGILSYTDLLGIRFADALDDDHNSVDTVIYNMFTLEQVMVKNSVNVSSITTIKDVSQILANGALHALPVADDFKLVELLPQQI